MNEKLEQAKNEIAKSYGYKDYYDYIANSIINEIYINKVAERYHELIEEDSKKNVLENPTSFFLANILRICNKEQINQITEKLIANTAKTKQ